MRVDANSIMKPDIAKKTIFGCITDYLEYLKNVKGLSKTTLTKYESMLHAILDSVSVPYMRITSDIINDSIYSRHHRKPYSNKYASLLTAVLQDMFNWAKLNSYTLMDVRVINPVTGLYKDTVKKSRSRGSKNSSNKVEYSFPLQSVSKSTPSEVVNDPDEGSTTKPAKVLTTNIYKRNMAIFQLFVTYDITIPEMEKLSIYDFMHNHIVIQSLCNRDSTRILHLKSSVRNYIYQYLCTRDDTLEYLFLSETPGMGITQSELTEILKDFKG